jgi:hypothetical protein
MREKVGHGVFGWEGNERRSNRYGAVHLADRPFEGSDRAKLFIDREVLERLRGKRVRLTAVVEVSRESGHCGDMGLQIFPTRPEVGEEIDLGVGILVIEPGYDGTPDIVLRPGDGRRMLWMDPRQLYRLHDQTASVYVEETTEAFHPAPDIHASSERAAYDTGDGYYQVKHVQDGDRVLPIVKDLGGGMFMLDAQPGKGMPLEVETRDSAEEILRVLRKHTLGGRRE